MTKKELQEFEDKLKKKAQERKEKTADLLAWIDMGHFYNSGTEFPPEIHKRKTKKKDKE